MTARAQMRATPTTTEAAEAAVRRGWRTAFWRPREPAKPHRRAIGHPRTPAEAATGAWPRPATPRTTSSAPATTRAGAGATSPTTTRPAPRTAITAATGRRTGWDMVPSDTGSWRRATRAGTRPACSAGMTDATTATPSRRRGRSGHSTSASGGGRWAGGCPMPAPGHGGPGRRRTRARARRRTPPGRPPPPHPRPGGPVGLRLVPRQRSRASSRRRCATRREKALKMMNAPTTRAMQTRTVKVVVNERTFSDAWEATVAERAAAVSTGSDGPTTACSRAARARGRCPGGCRDEHFADPAAETGRAVGPRPCRRRCTDASGEPGRPVPRTTPDEGEEPVGLAGHHPDLLADPEVSGIEGARIHHQLPAGEWAGARGRCGPS